MRKTPRITLYCPRCNGKGEDQPVLSELTLIYHPPGDVARDEINGYKEQGEKPEFRYQCPREGCGYEEIWTAPPSYQT